MSHPDDTDIDDYLDEPPLRRDSVTPRGGFMARPGLKAPPRHAVVIRGGDVEPSEDIPAARGSQPPPAPPRSELQTQLDLSPPRPAPPPLESLPPPSDMPVVASVPAPDLAQTLARRRTRSRWTVVAAAAAGLLLGLASIAATRARLDSQSRPAAAPAIPAAAIEPASPRIAEQAPSPPGLQSELDGVRSPSVPPSASAAAEPPGGAPAKHVPSAPEHARPAGSKRSIF